MKPFFPFYESKYRLAKLLGPPKYSTVIERAGEVIVCENRGATWLPFSPVASIKSTRGFSDEVIWRKES